MLCILGTFTGVTQKHKAVDWERILLQELLAEEQDKENDYEETTDEILAE